MAEKEELLKRVYMFSDAKLKETIKNEQLTTELISLADAAGLSKTEPLNKTVGNHLYEVATYIIKEAKKAKPSDNFKNFLKRKEYFCKRIASGDINTKIQFAEGKNYLEKLSGDELEINDEEFNKASGVGIIVTKEQLEKGAEELLKEYEEDVKTKGHAMFGPLLKIMLGKYKWGNVGDIRSILDSALIAKCGPKPTGKASKSENNNKEKDEKKKLAEENKKKKKKEEEEEKERITLQDSVHFHAPQENPRCPPELLAKHLEITGGKVVTRFPPEPNGYLHIGHAKAMNINFGYAKRHNGICYLRFDDTNPEKESDEYINSIIDSVKWLGHTPYKITYASDYFTQLYEYAVQLIKSDKAFVCNQTAAEIKQSRKEAKKAGGKPTPSPCRNRPIEESLKLFEGMKQGKYEEGEYTLRMKQNLDNPNPCMWDHVAYRIKYVSHPHAGDKWCIYPTYDYTHCICDSIENITHSLCSLEFEVRRESYDWLLDALDIYRSIQIEYSRLNITHTVLSKRKLIQLVMGNYVNGWDDPRLPTINGFRRRGFTPASINDFCERIGVSRSNNLQDFGLLEECLRQDLETKVPRLFAVLDPLKITITNWENDDEIEYVEAPNHPTEKSRGTRKIPFGKVIYIDKKDFRLTDSKSYYRLAPGKEVRLKYAYIIKCVDVVTDNNNNVVELKCTYSKDKTKKMKGTIHWVARPKNNVEPKTGTVRIYGRLFKHSLPEGTPDEPINFLDDLDVNSLKVYDKALFNDHAFAFKVGDRVQFEREGYFILDQDTKGDKFVWNRIVPLKEDKEKD